MNPVAPFDVTDAANDPFEQFTRWFEEAAGTQRDLDAVALATADAEGQPSVRMVLLRRREIGRYGFFTNYESRKGRDLAVNPRAAILWFNESLGRQVRIEGAVAPMDAADSDAYFASRPRGHQLGALASDQSRPLESRGALEARVRELDHDLAGATILRPAHWGGYWLTPARFEFWQLREDRLHDRVSYEPDGSGSWRRGRLFP